MSYRRLSAVHFAVALLILVGISFIGVNRLTQTEAAIAGDKTLAQCMAQPITPVSGTDIRSYAANGTNRTYDMRNATILQEGLDDYPFSIGGSGNCIIGPKKIYSNYPSEWPWFYFKTSCPTKPNCYNGAAMFQRDNVGSKSVYWKSRAHNIGFDAWRVNDGSSSFHIHEAYLTEIRDDCVSTGHVDFTLDDSYMECYTGISWRNTGAAGTEFNMEISNSLVYIMPQAISSGTCSKHIINGKGNGSFWKMDGYRGNPSLVKLNNVIIRMDQGNRDDCSAEWAAATYNNVTVVWTGEGAFPDTLPADVKLTRDISVWNNAKTAWMCKHGHQTTGCGTAGGDTTEPTVSITSPVNGSTVTVGMSANVTASASDNVGVTKVEFFVDGALRNTDTSSPYTMAWDTTGAAIGNHTLTAKAYDAAGNVKTSAAVTLYVSDGTSLPPTNGTINQTGNLATGKTFTATVASQTAGPPAYINDQNESTRWISTAADNVAISTDLGASYPIDAVAIKWAGDTTKNYDIQISRDNVTWITIASGQTANVTPQYLQHTMSPAMAGRYFRILAKDRWNASFGNSIWELGIYGTTDLTAPTVSLTAPSNGSSATIGSSVFLEAAATDNVAISKVEFYVGNVLIHTEAGAPYNHNWDTTGQTTGTKTLTARAYDAAGNVRTSAAVTLNLTSVVSGSGDANNDGKVNALDLSVLLSKDGQVYAPADFNGDGTVGAADMAILLSKWTW